MVSAEDLRTIFERSRSGGGFAEDPNIFRNDLGYAPGHFLRNPAKEGGKLSFRDVKSDELWTAEELNPPHLKGQGLESRVDTKTQNVVYSISGSDIRVGFYDRRQIEGVDRPKMSRDEFKESLRSVVLGIDVEAPRVPVKEIQPFVDTVLGRNFPNMFNYRSVVFDGDTTYGMFVDVDKALVGEPLVVKNVLLTPQFIKEHHQDMNYILPVLISAARQQGLDFLDLDVSDSISIENRLNYFIFQMREKYAATVSYKKTPQLAAVARLNGIPISLSSKDGHVNELLYGAIDMDDSHLAVISRGAFQDASDPSNSLQGPIIYRVTSREESVAAQQSNAGFGLLEIFVMKGCEVGDFDVQFVKTADAPRVEMHRDWDTRSALKTLQYDTTRGGYTAGHSTIGQMKKATIQTSPFGFESVLFRDVFCLVNEEMAANPRPYRG